MFLGMNTPDVTEHFLWDKFSDVIEHFFGINSLVILNILLRMK